MCVLGGGGLLFLCLQMYGAFLKIFLVVTLNDLMSALEDYWCFGLDTGMVCWGNMVS